MLNRLILLIVLFTLTACGDATAASKGQVFDALLVSQRAGGVTLAGGKAYFYIPGTTTYKTIYADRNKTTPAANPYTLSSDGTAMVYGDGLYDVKITNSALVQKFLWEDIQLSDGSENLTWITEYTSLANAVSTIGSTKTTLFIGTDQTLTGNLTIPATLEIIPVNGATITTTGYTLTYNGPIGRWPLTQIFAGSGAVAGLKESRPDWFATNTTPGTTDMTTAVQQAFDSSNKVHLSAIYLISSALTVRDNHYIYGDGDVSSLKTNVDIEVLKSGSTLWGVTLYNFFIQSTVTTAKTKYDVHLTNPSKCTLRNMRIQSGHNDSSYSETNVGGVFFEQTGVSSAYLNLIDNCWIQNNSIYFYNITDSVIKGGYVWGHTREFAIRLGGAGTGAIGIEKVVGIIASKYKGGIWLDGAGINQIRIEGNEFDGNPALDTGDGIYASAATIAVTVSGNTFWGCDKNAINIVDPYGWSITGNSFWKNNASDNSYDDIRITGVTSATGNTVAGNTHVIDDARTNKGYAIKEVNAGVNPVANTYSTESVAGNYMSPAFLFLNKGSGAPLTSAIPIPEHANTAFKTSGYGSAVAVTGTVDLVIAPEGGDFAGTLVVSNTRPDFPSQQRQTVYSVIGRESTMKLTALDSADGSGGGATFTVTMPSTGLIRVTNTFASATTIKIAFYGLQGF